VTESKKPSSKADRYRRERSDRLDALLRKVHKLGMDHLSDEEIQYLERVSEELSLELDAIDNEVERGPDVAT
jgi:hypothetical protein